MADDWTTPSAPSPTALLVVTSIFTVTSLSSVTLRFYARRLARLDILADDWLALAALFFTLVYNSTLLAGTSRNIIANYTHPTAEAEIQAKKYQLALQIIDILALGLTKLSFFCLWKRVFSTHPVHRLCTFLIGAVTVWIIAFILATILQCGSHVSLIWSSEAADEGSSCWWNSITAISIARTYFTIVVSYNNNSSSSSNDDESRSSFMHGFSLLALWAVIEVNVGILAACVTVVTRGVREVFADKRKKKFHMLSGIALKGDHDGMVNGAGTRVSHESEERDGV
ncbi:hypothetical protein AbraIFM66951_000957 [Aspergillus brasiliensis]|uniref:Rhodopsin domain-containing protein n=1 Tax=Aspergillus brasiliensis TaxID=319629 RepID=A0A9W5YKM2_9EURO|nr:hypothetical protein AbraCBS73388_000968 [Aspergillus brasiliensis]GKZ42249.1 hypothetical protein AbraIFM66951_000957 [Aspergillus brasiliensis]